LFIFLDSVKAWFFENRKLLCPGRESFLSRGVKLIESLFLLASCMSVVSESHDSFKNGALHFVVWWFRIDSAPLFSPDSSSSFNHREILSFLGKVERGGVCCLRNSGKVDDLGFLLLGEVFSAPQSRAFGGDKKRSCDNLTDDIDALLDLPSTLLGELLDEVWPADGKPPCPETISNRYKML